MKEERVKAKFIIDKKAIQLKRISMVVSLLWVEIPSSQGQHLPKLKQNTALAAARVF